MGGVSVHVVADTVPVGCVGRTRDATKTNITRLVHTIDIIDTINAINIINTIITINTIDTCSSNPGHEFFIHSMEGKFSTRLTGTRTPVFV